MQLQDSTFRQNICCMHQPMCLLINYCMSRLDMRGMPWLMCLWWKDCTFLLDIEHMMTNRGKDCTYQRNMKCMLRLTTDQWKDCTSQLDKRRMLRLMCLRWKDCMSRLDTGHILTDWQRCRCLPHTQCMRRMMCLKGKGCMSQLDNWCMLTDRR